MPGVVIFGHGGRGVGTSTGTYLLPPGVTIYFFSKDGQLLNSDGAEVIMDTLCTAHPNELAVQAIATETKTEFETVPNYTCYGTNDFRDPSGTYAVGQTPAAGPAFPIPDNTQKRLSDIIGGQSSGGVVGNAVYWLCCRDKPIGSNKTDISVDQTLTDGGGTQHILSGDMSAASSGLKPSTVARVGTWM